MASPARPHPPAGPALLDHFLPRCTPTVLCCGIAGILAVKKGSRPLTVDAGSDLAQCFAEIRKAPLSRVIAGKIKPEGYLAGVGPLQKMERDLLLLRQEPHFQVLFFNPVKAAALQSFIPQMTEFLDGEERLLEAEAGRFATAQMEVINSRLILLKDILWGLEKTSSPTSKRSSTWRAPGTSRNSRPRASSNSPGSTSC